MLRPTRFQELLHYIPEGLHKHTCVAGGYAADHTRASDVDLWVCSGDECAGYGLMLSHAWKVAAHLVSLCLRDRGRFAIEDFMPYAGNGRERLLIQTIPLGFHGKDIQILVSAVSGPQDLVEGFDISTHAIAKRNTAESYDLYLAEGWTGTNETPRVLRFDTPEDTHKRLHKICSRYNLKPDPEDCRILSFLIEGREADAA